MITLLGWLGAIFALVAYAQTGAARFRQIALLSSVALLTFNVLLGIWSNVVLESSLAVVNVRRLIQLRGPKRRIRCHPTDRTGIAIRPTAPVWSVSSHPG